MAKSPLRRFKEENGLSNDGIAALLTERIGEEVTTERVERQFSKGGRLPSSWADALGIDRKNPPADDPMPDFRVGDDDAPQPGANAKTVKPAKPEPVDELDWYNARSAIEAIYITIGEGVARIRHKPQIAVAFKQGAGILADDWIALAKVDARTRAVIAKLMVVGPGGKLAMDHLVLVGKIVSMEQPDGVLPGPERIVPLATPHSGAGAGDGAPGSVAAA